MRDKNEGKYRRGGGGGGKNLRPRLVQEDAEVRVKSLTSGARELKKRKENKK